MLSILLSCTVTDIWCTIFNNVNANNKLMKIQLKCKINLLLKSVLESIKVFKLLMECIILEHWKFSMKSKLLLKIKQTLLPLNVREKKEDHRIHISNGVKSLWAVTLSGPILVMIEIDSLLTALHFQMNTCLVKHLIAFSFIHIIVPVVGRYTTL